VIDGLSLLAVEGECLILRGPNGAGKTTLIRTLAGFLDPIEGSVMLAAPADELAGSSRPSLDQDIPLPEQSHYIGHLNGIKSNLTVAENLAFWNAYLDPGAAKGERLDRIDEALETFGLMPLEDIPAGYLSAGQKRRVGLARLLLADRPLWLLDEPTVSLDSASVAILAGLIERHLAGGGLAVAATHIPLGLDKARVFELSAPMTNLAARAVDEASAHLGGEARPGEQT